MVIAFMGAFRRGTDFKAEVADIHIRRAIIKIMSRHHQFFYETFHYAVAQQYGLPRGGCSTKQDTKEDQKSEEDLLPTLEGVILHVTNSELNLFPDIEEDPKGEPIKEDCTNIIENRKVYLNNNWQVKDSIGSPAFKELLNKIQILTGNFYFREYQLLINFHNNFQLSHNSMKP